MHLCVPVGLCFIHCMEAHQGATFIQFHHCAAVHRNSLFVVSLRRLATTADVGVRFCCTFSSFLPSHGDPEDGGYLSVGYRGPVPHAR